MLTILSEEQALIPDITIAPDGKTAELTAKSSGLKDGRHRARVEVLDVSGRVRDSKNVIFIVDTKPPELELVQPAEGRIAPPERSFLVRFSDEGSGIPPALEEMNVEARLNGKVPLVNVGERGGERILVVTGKEDWEQGQEDSRCCPVNQQSPCIGGGTRGPVGKA